MARLRRKGSRIDTGPLPYLALAALAAANAVLLALVLGRDSDRADLTVADAEVTLSPQPTETVEQQRPPTMEEVRAVLHSSEDVVVSVLGDSRGVEPYFWVGQWAELLAADGYQIVGHHWDRAAEEWSDDLWTYGDDGPLIEVWNGSHSGATAAVVHERFDQMQPVEPDVVLYSFGHNNTAATITQQLEPLIRDVNDTWGEQVPAAVIYRTQCWVSPPSSRSAPCNVCRDGHRNGSTRPSTCTRCSLSTQRRSR